MRALILVEHDNITMQPSIRHVLSAALQMQTKPVLLVVGHNCQSVAMEAATLAGVDTVYMVDNACYAHQLPETIGPLVSFLAPEFAAILASASTYGKNLLPRIAALLDVAQVSDVVAIIKNDTFKHPIYAGNALETVKVLDKIKLLTIRSTAFEAVLQSQLPCCIERIEHIVNQSQTIFISYQQNLSTRPELAHAKIVVAGGRGLQSAEKFKLIEELADVLSAGVGASRAAVDAGFVTNDCQIGQTGKIVAPNLYLAVGISGAVQHLAGMKDSNIIVAINKDADAPIFKIATYGLVGDLFELVPELIAELKNLAVNRQA